MKNRLLKLSLGVSVLMGFTTAQAQPIDIKMEKHITHSIPWIEIRLPYKTTAKELANIYYGNSRDAAIIVKANKNVKKSRSRLRKNMIIHIPVTANFKDQPERLGWQ